MERRFLDFLELAPRSSKPRTQGITIVKDGGEGITALRELLEIYGEYVDVAKFPINYLPMPARAIEEKIRLYRDNNIAVAVDDPMFILAYWEGKAEQFLHTLRDLGVTHVQIEIPKKVANRDEEERRYMALARELGFKIDGEVGQKYAAGDPSREADGSLSVEGTVAEMRRLLELGCEHVYLESAVIREVVGDHLENDVATERIKQVVDRIGLDKVVIEINGSLMPFDVAQNLRWWAVKHFGPEVNMGGSELIGNIPFIESMRRGISFIHGHTSNPRLYVNSLARNGGVAAAEWWKEEDAVEALAARS